MNFFIRFSRFFKKEIIHVTFFLIKLLSWCAVFLLKNCLHSITESREWLPDVLWCITSHFCGCSCVSYFPSPQQSVAQLLNCHKVLSTLCIELAGAVPGASIAVTCLTMCSQIPPFPSSHPVANVSNLSVLQDFSQKFTFLMGLSVIISANGFWSSRALYSILYGISYFIVYICIFETFIICHSASWLGCIVNKSLVLGTAPVY